MSTARVHLNDEIKRYRRWLSAEQITETEFCKQMEALGLTKTEIADEIEAVTTQKEH